MAKSPLAGMEEAVEVATSNAVGKGKGRELEASKVMAKEFEGNDDFISFAMSEEDEAPRNETNGIRARGAPKKRKYEDGPGSDRPVRRKGVNATPWFDALQWEGKSVQQMLTAEIASFISFIRPNPDEHMLRTLVIETIRRCIVPTFPDAQIHPFGSYGTQLYLPGGDIDLVILSTYMSRVNKVQTLHRIAGLLKQEQVGREVIVIGGAKVPIVKFRSTVGDFNVDISINQANGLKAMKTVQDIISKVGGGSSQDDSPKEERTGGKSRDKGKGKRKKVERSEAEEEAMKSVRELGPARCLIFVIKSLLKQRGMNEVFSGGLGSYSIICLVVSFLQLHPMIQQRKIDPVENLGVLLIEFFELYGKHFNYYETGISLNDGGYYYSKVRRGWDKPNKPMLLSIEDPADPNNDISGGSHNIAGVRMAFSGAFDLLTATMYHRQSLLLSRATGGENQPLLSVPLPASNLEDGEMEDPLSQSLLGDVMGVTEDVLKARKKNRELFEEGVVQRALDMDERIEMSQEQREEEENEIRRRKEKREQKRKDRLERLQKRARGKAPSEGPSALPVASASANADPEALKLKDVKKKKLNKKAKARLVRGEKEDPEVEFEDFDEESVLPESKLPLRSRIGSPPSRSQSTSDNTAHPPIDGQPLEVDSESAEEGEIVAAQLQNGRHVTQVDDNDDEEESRYAIQTSSNKRRSRTTTREGSVDGEPIEISDGAGAGQDEEKGKKEEGEEVERAEEDNSGCDVDAEEGKTSVRWEVGEGKRSDRY